MITLNKARRDAGLSVRQMSKKLHRTEALILTYERAKVDNLPPHVIVPWAVATGVEVEQLLGRKSGKGRKQKRTEAGLLSEEARRALWCGVNDPEKKPEKAPEPLPGRDLTYGERVRASRLAQGMNQKLCAKRLGYSQAVLSAWELGRKPPSAIAASAIEQLLKVKWSG